MDERALSGRAVSIARHFGRAAKRYERAATVQRAAASRLAARIAAARLPPRPRVLELGCGTGLLTASLHCKLPDADWTLSDLSPEMLRQCRSRFAADGTRRFLAMDAERPALRPGFDLICGSLVMQWFADRPAALRGLASLLNENGVLALSTLCADSFAGWRSALGTEGVAHRMPAHAACEDLQAEWPAGGAGHWQQETLLEPHGSGVDFLRALRAVGADLPRAGTRPANPVVLRRALRRFEAEHGAVAEYQIGYGLYRRAGRRGVFVAGTDTGVGKTLVAAVLARAWRADYWKPLQTGLAEEPGDTETVARLAELSPDRVVPPKHALQAALSPEHAAALERVTIDPGSIRLPPASPPELAAPLVVEGAGGLMVPVAAGSLMVELIERLGLPVVLVARGTLGTINHTLLSLEALRHRGIPVAGVVLNGAVLPASREAIVRHGRVRIIAELPRLAQPDADAVQALAGLMPPLASLQ